MSPSKCFSVLTPQVTVGETGQSQQGLVEFFHSHMYLCLKPSFLLATSSKFQAAFEMRLQCTAIGLPLISFWAQVEKKH
ncbi:hypothetical protein ARMGADRAFT_1083927 [Armillaria gallica]|uniref:Uncharacterized protein n=1 Tax=Armillaria gallica TaxID=47427 RepID=A0A2H3DJZ7_ARMGA|nr:hypothetical protein ARMGADRAFT_1083927 [Armillaria gallica]